MPNDNPGYIGYNLVPNEELQTGVHCCDIAMHIEMVRGSEPLNEAVEFLKAPGNSGDDILAAQNILVSFLKRTRRELCEFAIRGINSTDPETSKIFRDLLAPEIQGGLLDQLDFSQANFTNEDDKRMYNWIMGPNFKDPNASINLLQSFCKRPSICIDYINHYYLHGNQPGDDASFANMFIVPPPGSTGMLNIAAMQLRRKIIVISARNSLPFETADYSHGAKKPIYIGYDGHIHFVELQPYDLYELNFRSNNSEQGLEKSIYKNMASIRTLEADPRVERDFLSNKQKQLAEIISMYAEIKELESNNNISEDSMNVAIRKSENAMNKLSKLENDLNKCLTPMHKQQAEQARLVQEQREAAAREAAAREAAEARANKNQKEPKPEPTWINKIITILLYPFKALWSAVFGVTKMPDNEHEFSSETLESNKGVGSNTVYTEKRKKGFTPLCHNANSKTTETQSKSSGYKSRSCCVM